MFMFGEEVGGALSGGRRALFPFDQIFQNTLYVQNILYDGIRYSSCHPRKSRKRRLERVMESPPESKAAWADIARAKY